MKSRLYGFTHDWLRIKFHVDCGQCRLDEKWHQEKENEKAEDGYQAEEGCHVEEDILS